MGKLRKLFEAGNRLSAFDAEARLFVDARNAREYLKILHAEKFIYIHSWLRPGNHGKWTPIYPLKRDEDDRDVKSPAALKEAEISRRFRPKPEKWEHEIKQARIRRAGRKYVEQVVQLDPLMAALNRDATIAGS